MTRTKHPSAPDTAFLLESVWLKDNPDNRPTSECQLASGNPSSIYFKDKDTLQLSYKMILIQQQLSRMLQLSRLMELDQSIGSTQQTHVEPWMFPFPFPPTPKRQNPWQASHPSKSLTSIWQNKADFVVWSPYLFPLCNLQICQTLFRMMSLYQHPYIYKPRLLSLTQESKTSPPVRPRIPRKTRISGHTLRTRAIHSKLTERQRDRERERLTQGGSERETWKPKLGLLSH